MRDALFALIVLLATDQAFAQPLSGTKPLEAQGDLASQMVDGIDRFLLRETAASVEKRKAYWNRDTSSPEKYAASVEPNRKRLAKMLGVVDERVKDTGPRFISGPGRPSLVARAKAFEAHAVRWEALPGVYAEGLLAQPVGGKSEWDMVLLPDADQTPEEALRNSLGSLGTGDAFRVLIPTLVDRRDTYSVAAGGSRATNQPHREFVYRPAFEVGRHVIGYELQKVLAAVDWFKREEGGAARKVLLSGTGEGGMLALYAAALDVRIDQTIVAGYFGPRENLWREPIYRNVRGLLREFGDAEVASLVAPRKLWIEQVPPPKVDGPPPPRDRRSGAAPGAITPPGQKDVDREANRMRALGPKDWEAGQIHHPQELPLEVEFIEPRPDAGTRQKRQIDEMQAFTQALVRRSDEERRKVWAKADRSSVGKWEETTKPLRAHFYNDVIGRFDHKLLEANPRTRKVYDEPKYAGYEVMLDVWPDVFAYGILLVPKDIKPGERRPVVVCQHGLEGRPQDVADPRVEHKSYHQFGCKLAERGFVVYAPQNPYIFGDRFRSLQRKLNPLGKQLYSVILPQHEQTLNWLSTLPFVDPDRIAFYGLSYGGKTAMRVPAVEQRYCLSICSGDFNEWVWKTTSLTYPGGYVGTGEYEIFEWDLANSFNYAEMAGLIAPRPFMVERGHHDGVAPDEWVAYEYAKVRRMYVDLGIPDRTRIEYFPGPHEIHGVGTFTFLHEKLNRPAP